MSSDQHDHHSGACGCALTKLSSGVGSGAFAETLEQMAFSKSMSGFLVRGASPSQMAEYVRESAQKLIKVSKSSSGSPAELSAGEGRLGWTLAEAAAMVVNARDPTTGYTAIHHATRPQQPDRLRHCKVLISLGANVSLATPAMGWTALHRVIAGATAASLDDDVELVRLLVGALESGQSPDTLKDVQGNTPAMMAERLLFPGSDRLVAAFRGSVCA
jgi:hypothetical protein